jgi:hypothetical protein
MCVDAQAYDTHKFQRSANASPLAQMQASAVRSVKSPLRARPCATLVKVEGLVVCAQPAERCTPPEPTEGALSGEEGDDAEALVPTLRVCASRGGAHITTTRGGAYTNTARGGAHPNTSRGGRIPPQPVEGRTSLQPTEGRTPTQPTEGLTPPPPVEGERSRDGRDGAEALIPILRVFAACGGMHTN